jgi:DNA-binding transcriptional MerR regulator
MRNYTVSQAAKLAGVSVRTLHHYDEIGLLHPSGRSESGYRLYGDGDLARLQSVLIWRELGFSLEAIQQLVDAKSDRRAALKEQRRLLAERLERTHAVLRAVDATLAALEGGGAMDEKMFEGLEDEARERWGGTPQFAEAMRRTRRYKKEDWARMRAEMDAIEVEFASLLDGGASPDSAADLAERHRQHIERWFYPCDKEMHVQLSQLYTGDARFRAHFDERRAGLAEFVAAAIASNAKR